MASRRKRSARSRRQLPKPPSTVNERFFDAMLRHQVGVLRFGGSLGRETTKLLNATERDLARTIKRALASPVGFDTPAKLARLRKLLDDIRKIRKPTWDEVEKLWNDELLDLAKSEPAFISNIAKTVVPVVLEPTLPGAARLRSIVTSRPFEGKTLKQWARKIADDDIVRIQGQINIGLIQGETAPEIARRVIGSVRLVGQNGIVEITRRQAEAIVLTATNHVANQSAQEFFKANDDVFDDELYLATLDSRTTPVCRSLDGQRFKIGVGPIPPLHFRCRSRRVPLLDADAIGERPEKPVTEKQLLREYAEKEGLADIPKSRDDLPRGHKGRYDTFARGRVRQLTGQVPAKLSYQEWLERQPKSFQEDVLGKTRARLFRRGRLKLERFVDDTGRQKSLADLARDEAAAFRSAGLDPEDFLG